MPAVLAYGLVYTSVASLCSVFVPSLTPPGFMHVTIGRWPNGPAAAQRLAVACIYSYISFGLLALARPPGTILCCVH